MPFLSKTLLLLGCRGLYISDKAKVAAAVKKMKKAAAKKASPGKPKRDNAPILNPQGKPRRTISDEEEDNQSERSIDDASSQDGGKSPYESDWAHSSQSSAQATPVLGPQLPASEDPVQLTLTPSAQGPAFAARPPINIQLPANPVAPLMTIPANVLGTPAVLGGTLGSVPVASSALKKSGRRKSKGSGKSKKSKKSKRSRSRSRSSSLSSVSSVVVPPPPPPRPSADQVFYFSFSGVFSPT